MDQHLLIVGGTSGIGLALAEAAVDEGARVTIAGRDAGRLEEAVLAIGGDVRGESVDVSDEDSIKALFARVGPIDHLIATPGFDHSPALVAEADAAVVEKLFRTKFLGQYLLAKHAVSQLSESGSITLTSGVLSTRPAAGFAALASVNAGIEALGRTLALELSPRRVNVVSPGVIDTGKRFAHLEAAERTTKLQSTFGDALPVKRVGLPQDVAQAYLFAMQNPFLTGQTLTVDGGNSVR